MSTPQPLPDDAMTDSGGRIPTRYSSGPIDTVNMKNVEGGYFEHSNVNITNNFESFSSEPRPGADPKAEILAWLDAPNFREIYQSALEQRLGETGTWFMQESVFQVWAESKGSILWVTGIPGSGKTVIGSLVVHHLETSFEDHADIGVAFAFLRYSEAQQGVGILAALLGQLITTRAKAFAKMQIIYNRLPSMREARPTVRAMRSALTDITADFSKVYVVVDGFDEAGEMVRNDLFDWLPLLDAAVKYSLEARAEDIQMYITERIRLGRRLAQILKRKPKAEPKLRAGIVKKSGGMFLLAKLQMDEIISSSNSIRDLFNALGRLPSGMEEMYGLTLNRIAQQAPADVRVAHRVFNLLLQVAQEDCSGDPAPATRRYRFPPSTEDIQCAIAIDVEQWTLDWDSVTDISLVLSACCGLVVEVDAPETFRQRRYKTLRFIHYTTQGYLEKAGICGWDCVPSLPRVLDLIASLWDSPEDNSSIIEDAEGSANGREPVPHDLLEVSIERDDGKEEEPIQDANLSSNVLALGNTTIEGNSNGGHLELFEGSILEGTEGLANDGELAPHDQLRVRVEKSDAEEARPTPSLPMTSNASMLENATEDALIPDTTCDDPDPHRNSCESSRSPSVGLEEENSRGEGSTSRDAVGERSISLMLASNKPEPPQLRRAHASHPAPPIGGFDAANAINFPVLPVLSTRRINLGRIHMRKESYSLGRQQGRRFNSRSGTLILLLGQSGAGKSHFINTLAGRHLAAVSHGQGSGDLEVHDHIIEDPSPSGSRLILVDTPGWDNLYITDDKIMKKIKEWLDEQCDADVKVGGVLFLQDITGDRPNIPPEWPVKFLSGAVMRRLFLVTTKWDLSRSWFDGPAEAKQREAAKVEAWKELLQKGAQLRRFENNERSAWGVLNELLKSDPLDLGTLVKGLDQMGAAIKKALRPTNSDFKSSSAHRIIGFLGRLTP